MMCGILTYAVYSFVMFVGSESHLLVVGYSKTCFDVVVNTA